MFGEESTSPLLVSVYRLPRVCVESAAASQSGILIHTSVAGLNRQQLKAIPIRSGAP